MDNKFISFKTIKKKHAPTKTLSKKEVFLIKYSDGTKEVMTDYEPSSNSDIRQPVATIATISKYPAKARLKLKKSDTFIDVIVHESNSDGIEYRRANNPNGPLYKKSKSEIDLLEYIR